ncbi:MAG: LytTR family DNA-binding domain-containing protein [Bacteroidetes bacterium]|nr:LytTR family DNA-binding domain-containing protein [Bacteroidota bacterium]
MTKCLIIEDEFAASSHLAALLKKVQPDMEILAIVESIKEGILWFNGHPEPDLIFSDIQIADGLSFSIFDSVKPRSPIIFTTAYNEYAIKAFKLNSIDYLLKPIDLESISFSLKKFSEQQLLTGTRITELMHAVRLDKPNCRLSFLVRYQDRLLPVSTDEVMASYIDNGIVYLLLQNGKQYPVDMNLDDLQQQLDPQQFFRANRQFIVSRKSIHDMAVHFNGRLLLNLKVTPPETIYISKERVSSFKRWFEAFH